jgi:spore germination protein YaaH
MRKNLNIIICFVLFSLIISLSALSYAQYITNNTASADRTLPFSDVPKDSYAYGPVHELRSLGITNGIGNNKYGFGQTMTRGEFITFLVKMMGYDDPAPKQGSFTDNTNIGVFYFGPIETALKHDIISNDSEFFRPNDPVTREEAAVMIVNSLGYGNLAERLSYFNRPYEDVTEYIGHITIAKDFGIISDASEFSPQANILREQAAAMLVRMKDAMERRVSEINGFYAISSSSQRDKLTDFDSVCFGWSSLSFDKSNSDIVLNMSRNALGYNDFYLPVGFSDRLATLKESEIPAFLMVYANQQTKITDPLTGKDIGLLEYILNNTEVYTKVIDDIINALSGVSRDDETGTFDGVVIDFESMRSEQLKGRFNIFLKDLRSALDRDGKKLYVAVHPLIHPKRSAVSIDGYDYRTIGALADRVIFMAHDYDAKRLTKAEMQRGTTITPLTPIEDVYYALEAITDKDTGVQDRSKILLQISFDWTVWQKKDGKTQNSQALSYDLDNFMKLLNSGKEISFNYSDDYENPYLKYVDPGSGVESTVWYENSRSVLAKIKLARYFDIQGISIWRLGSIPDAEDTGSAEYDMDVWQSILKEVRQDKAVQDGNE